MKKIESVLKRPAPYPVPDSAKSSPIKKTITRAASTSKTDPVPSTLAAPSPDDAAKMS